MVKWLGDKVKWVTTAMQTACRRASPSEQLRIMYIM